MLPGLPGPLEIVARLNPLSYDVDAFTDGEGSPGRDPSLTFGMTTYRSAPVTANHLSSEPDITKMIGATH